MLAMARQKLSPTARHARLEVRVHPSDLELLDQLAWHWGTDRSGAVRRAILESARREGRKLARIRAVPED